MVIEVKDSFLNFEKFVSVTNPVRVTKAKILLTKANALRMGRYKKALRFYKKYLELKPRSNNIFSVRSRIDILKLKTKQNRNTNLTLL